MGKSNYKPTKHSISRGTRKIECRRVVDKFVTGTIGLRTEKIL